MNIIAILFLVLSLGWMTTSFTALMVEAGPRWFDDEPTDAEAQQIRSTSRRWFYASIPVFLAWVSVVAVWWSSLSWLHRFGLALPGMAGLLFLYLYCRYFLWSRRIP